MLKDQQNLDFPQPPRQRSHTQCHWNHKYLPYAILNVLIVLELLLAGCGAHTQKAFSAQSQVASPTQLVATPTSQVTSTSHLPPLPPHHIPVPTPSSTPNLQNPLLASQVDKLLTAQVQSQLFSGSVLIAENGQIIFNKGYSMADWDSQVPNKPQTKFYIGSLTKEFTATAIMLLQERGKLHVRDALCSYIPNCPYAWQSITIDELMEHTSGIPQLDDSQVSIDSPEAWIGSYNGVGLAFPPGSEYNYCSACFQILGYVVERASGQPYSTFLQQTIFNPVHMKDTSFGPDYYSLPEHAIGYAGWQFPTENIGWSVSPEMSFLFASGLLHTTVQDLYRWDQALYSHTVLSQRSLNAMYTPYVQSEFASSNYGYAWFLSTSPIPHHRLIWHYGSVDGFTTYFGRYIDDNVTIIFLSNLDSLDYANLASQLERIVFAKR